MMKKIKLLAIFFAVLLLFSGCEAPREEFTLKSRSLIWSVTSFVLGVLSLALCFFYYVSLAFAAGAVVTSLVSRKNLGFFEKWGILGLIFGIMGIVFGISFAIAKAIGIF